MSNSKLKMEKMLNSNFKKEKMSNVLVAVFKAISYHWTFFLHNKKRKKCRTIRNKYGSVQELRSTFGHLKFIQITQSFVQGLGLVWISQILVLFFQISFGKVWTDKTRVWFGLVRLNWNCLSLVWCDQVQFGLVWPNLLRLSFKSGIFEWRPWTLKK